jgi:hypothetical protein
MNKLHILLLGVSSYLLNVDILASPNEGLLTLPGISMDSLNISIEEPSTDSWINSRKHSTTPKQGTDTHAAPNIIRKNTIKK